MKAACVIPARLESSRFPRKMLHLIQGKSLIRRTVENARSFPIPAYVLTDSIEIAREVQDIAPIIFTSSKPKTGTDRIVEALYTNQQLQSFDLLVNAQGDHPFLSPKTVENLLEAFAENPSLDIATAVQKISKKDAVKPQVVKCVFSENNQALYFSRSLVPHGAEEYYQHIGVYAYKTRFLHNLQKMPQTDLEQKEQLEQLRFLEKGFSIQVVISENPHDVAGVDFPIDALACGEIAADMTYL